LIESSERFSRPYSFITVTTIGWASKKAGKSLLPLFFNMAEMHQDMLVCFGEEAF
jgi:hypothetical protein